MEWKSGGVEIVKGVSSSRIYAIPIVQRWYSHVFGGMNWFGFGCPIVDLPRKREAIWRTGEA